MSLDSALNRVYRSFIKLATNRYLFSALHTRKEIHPEQPDQILIVAALFMGDLMMLSPFVAQIKRDYPKAKIILICSPGLKPLADLFGLDVVIEERKITRNLARAIKSELRPESVHVYNIFSWQLIPLINWLVPSARLITFPDPKYRLNHLANKLVPFPDKETLAIEIPLELIDSSSLPHHVIPLDSWKPQHKYAVIHVGARVPTRRLPIKFVKKFMLDAIGQGLRVCITAAHGETSKEIIENVLLDLGLDETLLLKVDWFIGTLKLDQLSVLLTEADHFFSMDTGVAHLAKALGVPSTIILGPSQPELFGGDNVYSRSMHYAVMNLACRDKKTFHGQVSGWVNKCDVSACPLVEQLCTQELCDIFQGI